ncbi:MAG: transglycosylase domain-containing protein [Bacteroidetes bacterium]|nr:transglycosylase domain-containing protein [Bacteroidota bacterium]
MAMSRFKKTMIILWCAFGGLILCAILFFVLISKGVFGFMPTFDDLENPRMYAASEVISADGVILGTYFKENRVEVEFNQISPYVINALIATEDVRFYDHSGIDFSSLGRVVVKTVIMSSQSSGGGSTISQQLAKLLFPRENFSSKTEIALRKFKEWIIAVKLEKSYTKEEIMTMYLNKFDFLHNANGIKMAAEVYFRTTPDSLNLVQSAMLVGMLKNPSIYNPRRNPEGTLERRNVVLSQMHKYGKLSAEEFETAKAQPLGLDFKTFDHNFGAAPYFREWLRVTISATKPIEKNYWSRENFVRDSILWADNPLFGWCNKNEKAPGEFYNIYLDGLKIYTTLDSRMQTHAENAMKKHMSEIVQPAFDKENANNPKSPFASDLTKEEYENRIKAAIRQSDRYKAMPTKSMSWDEVMKVFNQKVPMTVFSWQKHSIDTVMSPLDSIRYMKRFLRCGLLSLEPKTGHVKAFVGGINYKYFQYDHIMQQRRQVGSTFKPFLYTLAMQEGMSPCKQFANVPTTFYLDNGTEWTPHNSDDARKGEMVSLAWALATSNNLIAAKLMQLLRPEPVINLAREMGVYNHIDPVPSICLGVADLTLHEMTGAFGTFPNGGVFTEPLFVTRIEDKHGKVIANFTAKQNEAISTETAYLMVTLLQNVVNMRGGTAVALHGRYQIKVPVAGKTGTTQSHADGWFIGFTPELVTGVWVGGEEKSIRFRSFQYGQGARMAMPMFAYYLNAVVDDKTITQYNHKKGFEKPAGIDYSRVNCESSGSGSGGFEQTAPSKIDDRFY